jgi:hypothetical protein
LILVSLYIYEINIFSCLRLVLICTSKKFWFTWLGHVFKWFHSSCFEILCIWLFCYLKFNLSKVFKINVIVYMSGFLFFNYFCAGWGYIGVFPKELTLYQIYHTWFHVLHCSSFPSPLIPAKLLNWYHFCFYSHSYPLFVLPLSSLCATTPFLTSRKNLFHPPVLWFCRRIN